jgi:MFS family permease
MSSSIADNIGTVLSAVLYDKFGVRIAFLTCLVFTLVGGATILLFHSVTSWMPLFIMIGKMGTSSTFNLVFLSNSDLFPTLFSATAMGICNFFARLSTIAAPQVAERPEPLPMTLYLIINVGAVVCASQLRQRV